MSRYVAICSYDGTNFLGYQRQNEGRTVQGIIEEIISKILNTPTTITASGRTDAKVHALYQPFHFDVNKEIDESKFKHSLNCLLPDDIVILDVYKVKDDFHARINAKEKTYSYIINMGERNPLKVNYEYELGRKLDIELIKKASRLFEGTHNFKNFTSKEEDFSNFIRTITSIDIECNNDILIFKFTGNGFMRYMIRMIVGTLVEIGLHKIDVDYITKQLENPNRNICSYKAPGQGLYLEKVNY